MSANLNTEQQGSEQKNVFTTQRIYVKKSSFDSPLTPAIFKETPVPKVEMQAHTNYVAVEPNVYEATLTLNLTNQADEKILWRLELHQAGIFTIDGFSEEQLKQVLHGFCMNVLYPYACEAVSAMVVRSGFQPVYLTPMNFEVLYREQLRRQTNEAPAAVM